MKNRILTFILIVLILGIIGGIAYAFIQYMGIDTNNILALVTGTNEVTILGFQRRVWWPKWTPASSRVFMDTTFWLAMFVHFSFDFSLLPPGASSPRPTLRHRPKVRPCAECWNIITQRAGKCKKIFHFLGENRILFCKNRLIPSTGNGRWPAAYRCRCAPRPRQWGFRGEW